MTDQPAEASADQPAEAPVEAPVAEERHASWAELFFDLVVVAGVGTLAHVLHEDVTWASLALYAVLFLTFWLSWTTFMLYGNASGPQTRTIRLLVGMFGLAVMAASVPGVAEDVVHEGFEGSHFEMANAFALAYFLTRVIGAGAWRRDQIVTNWPLAQRITGALPFLASVWVDEPWKYALWAAGIGVDLVLLIAMREDELLDHAQQRVEALARRDPERMSTFGGVSAVVFDPGHLAERLGLFVIIVLGEGVIQSVQAASGAEWDHHLLRAGVASFVLLSGMWGLSVVYGYAGVPHLRPDGVGQRLALALHCGTTASIAAVAACLGGVVGHGEGPMHDAQRWLLCGAIALYFTLGLVASFFVQRVASSRRTITWGWWVVTGVVVPLLIGFYGDETAGLTVVTYLALVVVAHIVVERRAATANQAAA